MAESSRAPSELLGDGVGLFNEGFFFEAHEVLEEAWHLERGPSRLFLQGLIQVAAGFHHLQSGNRGGASSLFRKALGKLGQYPADFLEIDSAGLIAEVKRTLQHIEELTSDQELQGIPAPKILRRIQK